MILSTFAWGVAVNRYPALRWVSSVAIGCAIWSIVCLVMLVTESSQQGQYQRFAAVLLGGWMLAFVVALWRAGLWRSELEWRRPDYAPRRRHFRR
jgi:membrane protein DedA with SNARE-associated domain